MSLAALPTISPLLPTCSSWNLQLDKLSFLRNGGAEAKAEALRSVVQTYERSRGQLEKCIKYRQDWIKNLARQHGLRLRTVRLGSTSPLILHLGRASVLENVGVYCERTTGLPVIAGTTVKGVLSTWACWEANQNDDGSFRDTDSWSLQRSEYPTEVARRIFGSDAEISSKSSGEISFLGAWPVTIPKLLLDIVNPHHDSAGRDLSRLTPSVFLSLESGTAWDFVFLARNGINDTTVLLDMAETWLSDCLSQVGLGAKTASGYGRFEKRTATKAGSISSTRPQSASDLALRPVAEFDNDYNDTIFKNAVLSKLAPNLLEHLKSEVPKLQKSENGPWLERLKQQLIGREAKDLRKRLKEKTWFPQEWLPPQS